MRTAAYDLTQFAPAERREREKPQVRVVDNPKRKRKNRAYRVRLVVMSALVLVLMSLTVYNNMLLTEAKSAVTGMTAELNRLESEYSYLNYQLESTVSLKNAEEFALTELGLVKLSASQVQYVTLRGNSAIVEEAGAEETGFFDRVWNAVKGIFA